MSIGDPLGQESPTATSERATYQAQGVEDDPEAGGRGFSGAASFEQEPRGAPPPATPGTAAWTSANPVAGAGVRPYRGATNEGFVNTVVVEGGSSPSRDRFDLRSRSMGSLGSATDSVGVAPMLRQSPDYSIALDRLVAQPQRGMPRHMRGVGAGNHLESSLFAADDDNLSPRKMALGVGDLARVASNANGIAWRSGSRPQDALTATEVLAAQAQARLACGDVEHGSGNTSPLQSWTAAAASVFGIADHSGTGADARRRLPSLQTDAGGGGATNRTGMSGVGENCLVIMTMVTMGCVLYVLQQVLVPLVLAVFVSAMLLPMLDFVTERPFHLFGRVWLRDTCGLCLKVEQRYDNWLGHLISSVLTFRLPNVIGLLVVLCMLVVLGFGLGVLVYASVDKFLSKSPYYEEAVFNITRAMPEWVISHVGRSGKAALSQDQLFGTYSSQHSLPLPLPLPLSVCVSVCLSLCVSSSVSMCYIYFGRNGWAGTLTDSAAASEVVIDILLTSEHLLATTALTFLYTIFILLGRQDRTVREANRTLVVIEDQLQVSRSLPSSLPLSSLFSPLSSLVSRLSSLVSLLSVAVLLCASRS